MLNKATCRRCTNKRSENHLEDWDYWSEKMWSNGEVWCYWVENIKITEDPPENCEYRLEHLVLRSKYE